MRRRAGSAVASHKVPNIIEFGDVSLNVGRMVDKSLLRQGTVPDWAQQFNASWNSEIPKVKLLAAASVLFLRVHLPH